MSDVLRQRALVPPGNSYGQEHAGAWTEQYEILGVTWMELFSHLIVQVRQAISQKWTQPIGP